VERIAAWLVGNLPASPDSGAASLIHNDFKFDNLVLDPDDITRVLGILDWEMSTLGDPLMDLGTSLSYWVEPDDPPMLAAFRFGPTNYAGMMTRVELAQRYHERTGRDTSGILFYFCFGLFKTAVVVQQIYYRYRQGLTQDPRFAAMIAGVRLLSQLAVAAVDRGRL
jgi:aminoglycoside phosphotransferase (APT) family kinase protein